MDRCYERVRLSSSVTSVKLMTLHRRKVNGVPSFVRGRQSKLHLLRDMHSHTCYSVGDPCTGRGNHFAVKMGFKQGDAIYVVLLNYINLVQHIISP